MPVMRGWLALAAIYLAICGWPARGAETVWIEAENLDGVRGYCWPMGQPDMKKTDGRWGLSGPGWAAAWNLGGESGFLSAVVNPHGAGAIDGHFDRRRGDSAIVGGAGGGMARPGKSGRLRY